MTKWYFLFLFFVCTFATVSCSDDDSFSDDPGNILTFPVDTLKFDTLFSTVPSSTKSFWIYNNSGDGILIRQVRLSKGNQTGFRVNVDGLYLDNAHGSQVFDLEIRKGDSIRVFTELTSNENYSDSPVKVSDDLCFTLASGVVQKVNLTAYSWDAVFLKDIVVKSDSVISSEKPIVVYGGIVVDSAATLTVNAPATLYFHDGAGLDVYGRLVVNGGASENKVVFRGDRTDRMFDYLPYDRVSGQWDGIRFRSSSTNNLINGADIHSSKNGIVCDSAAFDENVLRLEMNNTIVHNSKGNGLLALNSNVKLVNCQITNALENCVSFVGGAANIYYCTFAQFYPFDAQRGSALHFANYSDDVDYPLYAFNCVNSLVTGYANDEIMGNSKDTATVFSYYFQNCILKTPEITDTVKLKESFVDVIFESQEDSINSESHFRIVDSGKQYYDFHLDSLSTAIGRAKQIEGIVSDIYGKERGETPDIGCCQY